MVCSLDCFSNAFIKNFGDFGKFYVNDFGAYTTSCGECPECPTKSCKGAFSRVSMANREMAQKEVDGQHKRV